jgi:small-conductance mechanosensitive channel
MTPPHTKGQAMGSRLFTAPFFALVIGVALLCLAANAAQAQGLSLPAIPGLPGSNQEEQKQTASAEELSQSLEVTIQALQDDSSRKDLIKQLQTLQQGLQAQAIEDQRNSPIQQGLLGALAGFFDDLTRSDGAAGESLGRWKVNFDNALRAGKGLIAAASFKVVAETAIGLALGAALLYSLSRLARMLFTRRDWPLEMPRRAKPWMLMAHFARRIIPWILTLVGLFLLLGLRMLAISDTAQSTVLVLAYISLCGRLLTSLFDVMISVFSSGHRTVAVAILHKRTLFPLFIIGALFALSDALGSSELGSQLGADLASTLALVFSMLGALLAIFVITRNRRPITHLIRNQPYSQRKNQGVWRELVGLLARLWHIPLLLALGASMVAVFAKGGSGDAALGKALIVSLILIVTLAAQGVVGIQKSSSRHKSLSTFSRRLVTFGYRLLQIALWLAFFETALQVWDLSLLGLANKPSLSAGLADSLFALTVTGLVASLTWTFADELLERAVRRGDRKKRLRAARAQTIVPIVRTTLLIIIVVVAFLVSLSIVGVDVTPLLAGAGIVGLAVGFGAQTLVQDLITGLFIVVEDSMSVGDFVEINGFMGTVEGFNLRTVRLRDLEAVVHHITFSKISSIHNMSRQFGIALMKIRVPPDLPIDDAIKLMTDTAEELRADPAMRWLIWSPLEMQGIHAFEDGCPVLRMRMRTKPEYQWDVSRAFNLMLKRRMEDLYLDLAAPRISVQMEAGGGARSPGRGGQAVHMENQN